MAYVARKGSKNASRYRICLTLDLDIGLHFSNESDITEETLYQTFSNYVYSYTCLLHWSFDQEQKLRTRFFWKCPIRKNNNNEKERSWLWLYGLDIETMKNLARNLISKNKIIEKEKAEYLIYDQEKNGYKIKSTHSKLFDDYDKRLSRYGNKNIDFKKIFNIELIDYDYRKTPCPVPPLCLVPPLKLSKSWSLAKILV